MALTGRFGLLWKHLFYALNAAIIAAGVFCLIWANVHFGEAPLLTGSFIGGHVAALAPAVLVYGTFGIYAIYRQDRVAVAVYGAVAMLSLLSRLLLWALAAVHRYRLPLSAYTYSLFECAILTFAAVFFFLIN